MLGPVLALLLLSFALAWAVFLKAAVEPLSWALSLLVIGFVSQGYFWVTPRIHRAPPLPRWVRLVIWALPAYLVFQLIPFPLALLHFLSPARANLATALAAVIPGIHTAPLAENPAAATLGLFTILGYAATFLTIREVTWRWSDRPWITAIPLIVLAAIEALIGMVQVSTGSEMATGTYLSHDHFPGLLEMVLPFAILYGLAILRRTKRRLDSPALPAVAVCGMWAIAALLFLAIIYSLSRGGLLVALCVLLFLCITLSARRLPLTLAGTVAAVLLAFCIPNQLLSRFAMLPNEPRPYIWRETLPLIREFVWFGCGLGGFESNFLKYQAVLNGGAIGWAHNDYLQFLAELGLVGFTILAAVLVGIALPIFRGIRRYRDQERRLLVVACAGSFFAILLHSLIDFNMYVPANAMTLAWIAGIGSANGRD